MTGISTIHEIHIYSVKDFLKIIETQSLFKAAQELYFTQPAVSIQPKIFFTTSLKFRRRKLSAGKYSLLVLRKK